MSLKIITPVATQLERRRLIAFAAPALPVAATMLALAVYLPAFYAEHVGLGLGTVGAVFMLSRLCGAFSDPLIGLASDRTRSRFGRRKPWIMGGGLLSIVATVAVFIPPAQAGPLYLAAGLFALCLGNTMISAPLYAWSAELATQYHERSRVQAYLMTATALGLLLVQLLPQALHLLNPAGGMPATQAMGLLILASLLPALFAIFGLREQCGRGPERGRAPASLQWRTLRSLAGEPLLLRVVGSDLGVSLGQGFRTSLFVFFVSSYMGLPQWAGPLFLLQTVFGVLVGPIWLRIGYRLGKSRAVIAGELGQTALNLALLALDPGDLKRLIVLTAAQGLMQASGNLMLKSIVADLVDVQRLKTGQVQAGLLFSVFNVTANVSLGLAVGIAFPLVGAFGFVPGGVNSAASLSALHWVFALGPALGHLTSAVLMLRFPLDQQRHSEIQRQMATSGLLTELSLPRGDVLTTTTFSTDTRTLGAKA